MRPLKVGGTVRSWWVGFYPCWSLTSLSWLLPCVRAGGGGGGGGDGSPLPGRPVAGGRRIAAETEGERCGGEVGQTRRVRKTRL